MNYPISRIRSEFPIFMQSVNHHPLSYLDSAASAQKPNIVINCESNYYRQEYAAVHRGIHTLSNIATSKMEVVRAQIANFINACSAEEIIFTKGSTEGINLLANSWGRNFLYPGDNILLTKMEHHANIVPWQILANEKKLTLRYIPLLPDGTLDISHQSELIDERTKIFAVSQISNVLGVINPLSTLIDNVRALSDAIVIIDGAQGIVHQKVDVQKLDCDFYVFSGHKFYGPSGIGVLYGKKSLLNVMPPWEGGGSMVRTVDLNKGIVFNDIPWRFEAGSPNTAGIIGLGAAIDYIEQIGIGNIHSYENSLTHYALEKLNNIPKLIIYGPLDRTSIISFNLGNHHAYDVGTLLDKYGIAIRTGHHCAMPLMKHFQVSSMCRASIAMYNNLEDINRLVNGLIRIQSILS